jgi:polar amino acid transport system permease protein
MEMLISASVIYWLMSMVLEVIQSRIERRFRKSAR